ncbi:MAG: hypothetical protein K6E95_05740 [Lachnospiraceae bacterium]|nr:hypothetical protein [Lachnospiraceae bacterium]
MDMVARREDVSMDMVARREDVSMDMVARREEIVWTWWRAGVFLRQTIAKRVCGEIYPAATIYIIYTRRATIYIIYTRQPPYI